MSDSKQPTDSGAASTGGDPTSVPANQASVKTIATSGETIGGTSETILQTGLEDLPDHLRHHSRYRLVRKLGEGGMGAVYLAEHMRMERRVALKVIRAGLIQNEQAMQRFYQEVKAASRLSHPNIVTAYDADESGEGASKTHFLVMEFVEGETLDAYLRRVGPLPPGEACACMIDAANGLQHAYEKGMVHRDIKPQNLIRTPQGRIKILDFGLARIARDTDASEQATQITSPGSIMGTVDYMAPEQANDSHSADIRADLYALGCTLYQALSGKVPFPTGSITQRLIKHASEQPVAIDKQRADVPKELAAVLMKVLAKKPEARYATPADLAQALAPFAQGQPQPGTTATLTVVQPPPPRGKSGLFAAAVLAGLVLLGAAGYMFYPRSATPGGGTPAAGVTQPGGSVAKTAVATNGEAPDFESDDDEPGAKVVVPVLTGEFLEIHGATQEKLNTWLNETRAKRLMPQHFSARLGTEPPLFDAVAIGSDFFMPMSGLASTGPSPMKSSQPRKSHSFPYRTAFISNHTVSDSISIMGPKIPGQSKFACNVEFVGDKLKERLDSPGLRPVAISASTRVNGGTRTLVTFGACLPQKWNYAVGIKADELKKLEKEQRSRNWMFETLCEYGTPEDPRYIVTQCDNPEKKEWVLLVDVPQAEYEKALSEQLKRNLRPSALGSRQMKSGVLYTALFVPRKN